MNLPRRLQVPALLLAVVLLLIGLPLAIAVLGTPRGRSGNNLWSSQFSFPTSLRAGERFPLSARFRNGSGSRVRMLGIDFGPGIATGIEIDGSTPPWSRSSRLPDGGLHAEFDLPIADGGGIELEFAARATRAGTFSDQIHSRFDDEHWSGVLPASFAVDP